MSLAGVRVLLCDADGNLFPSEEPAFEASTAVTNRLLADLGVDLRFEPVTLRRAAAGRNFRSTAQLLAREHDRALAPARLEELVAEERQEVIAHLGAVLAPDPAVLEPLARLARRFSLAAVSSSALARLAACFEATGLDRLFPPERRFSAEDSLAVPTSKPDPAVYRLAGRELGLAPHEGLAIEDAVPGVLSAVAAGFPAVGNLVFVPEREREAHEVLLRRAGATAVIRSWWELVELLEAV